MRLFVTESPRRSNWRDCGSALARVAVTRKRSDVTHDRYPRLRKIPFFIQKIQIKLLGSREEDEVAGFFVFSHIRMRGQVNECPAGVNISSAGLEPPAGARNSRKATVKKRRNTAPGFIQLDPFFSRMQFVKVSSYHFESSAPL